MTDIRLVEPGGGDHYWLMGVLATIKAGGPATGDTMTISEFEVPPGWAVPPHRHSDQDELFYVLDGEVTFWCDGAEATYTRGGFAWLPRNKPHTFRVSDSGPARLFNIHTGVLFEAMVHALGEPAPAVRIPDPPIEDPDPQAIIEAFAQFGIEVIPAEV